MRTIVKTPASVEPVTLDEAKAQLRIEQSFTQDDSYIESLISAARDRCEKFCGRYFTEQQIEVVFDESLPDYIIDIPFPDVSSVNSIKYTVSGLKSTLSDLLYSVDFDECKIYSASSFPSGSSSYSINITTSPPAEMRSVKQAILLIISDLYEQRTESIVGAQISINQAVNSMLWSYRSGLGL